MTQRRIWLDAMKQISYPVLSALSEGRLHEVLPLDFHPNRKGYALLEAFGRTMCGIAPWLEATGLDEQEAAEQKQWISMSRSAMRYATDPDSPDFMNFTTGDQPLVDAAFLSHAIVRAPHVLGESLDAEVKAHLVAALKSSRVIRPGNSNWLFFSAMVEAALFLLGEEPDREPVDRAMNFFIRDCYVGDGTYGDGRPFHWDYYNSFVIQPMFVDILRTFACKPDMYPGYLDTVLKRACRYSAVQEQLINADGTYAVFGRSTVYRFGAFQLLSEAALQDFLDPALKPGQVRAALTAVIEKCLSHPDTFDENGFLRPGVYGYQPSMAEGYISIGSLYLCCAVFVSLGLSPDHPFWSDPPCDWTAKKIWGGVDQICDHCRD